MWATGRQSDRTQPTPLSSPLPAALVGGEGSRLDQLQYDVRKGSVVNVNPTNTRAHSETPEIRKYKKRFNSEILCAALWGKPRVGKEKKGLVCPHAPGQVRAWLCLSSAQGLLLQGSTCWWARRTG